MASIRYVVVLDEIARPPAMPLYPSGPGSLRGMNEHVHQHFHQPDSGQQHQHARWFYDRIPLPGEAVIPAAAAGELPVASCVTEPG